MALVHSDPSKRPGTHAFIVGVSAYQHLPAVDDPSPSKFGMSQLYSAARSASEFAAWLINEYNNPSAPLSTLHVLLSPTGADDEIHTDIAARLPGQCAATRANFEAEFEAFHDALLADPNGTAIVYVAGHGVQLTTEGAILLLNDFNPNSRSVLQGAANLYRLRQALRFDQSARTQFWFIDTCRQLPDVAQRYESLSGAYEIDIIPSNTHKESALFLACSPRGEAFAHKQRLTFFCEALLNGLKSGEAANSDGERQSPWRVSSLSLASHLDAAVSARAAQSSRDQHIICQECSAEGLLHVYHSPPRVALTVTVTPESAYSSYTSFNLRSNGKYWIEKNSAWPTSADVPAGLYIGDWHYGNPGTPREDQFNLRPSKRNVELCE